MTGGGVGFVGGREGWMMMKGENIGMMEEEEEEEEGEGGFVEIVNIGVRD